MPLCTEERTMATVRGTDGWLYRQEFTKCNKPGCKRCERGPGHGPYWYKFRREDGRLVKKYVGKNLPRYVEDESAVQKALQKTPELQKSVQKTDAQPCPVCGKPLGDNLAELVGFEGLIYHKTCHGEKREPAPSPDVEEVLRAIKSFHDQSKEPLVSEVAEAVGMETRPMGRLLSKHGIQATKTHRNGKQGRFFTFDLGKKIEEMLG